ncbi:hypothetical protein [Streptomyces sp. NPDC007100]|uniref:hypothetical protein n=1 Tax=Streptomyces sp. NPDC007100 TaxID=3155602 RepID=UPI0033C0B232
MSDRTRTKPRVTRGGVLLTLAAVLAGALSLYAAVLFKDSGTAWSLTYEAASTSGAPGTAEVRYAHDVGMNPGSERQVEKVDGTRLPWHETTVVGGGKEAWVEVTPAGNGTASCRILLDGEREVASGRSPGPGKPAVCRVTTSDTQGEWPERP